MRRPTSSVDSLRPNLHTIRPICPKWYWKLLLSHRIRMIVCTFRRRHGVTHFRPILRLLPKGVFTPDANKLREVGRLNILSLLASFATQQTWIRVMGGASAGSSSLVAKCIPVFVKVWRCIYSSGYPHTTTIHLSSIVVWDFLPPLVITSLLEQAPDWLTRREYPPKFRFFNSRHSRRRIVFRVFALT